MLNALKRQCPETKEQLANNGVVGHNEIRERRPNLPDTLLEVFTNWHTSLGGADLRGAESRNTCGDLLALYVTLRVQ